MLLLKEKLGVKNTRYPSIVLRDGAAGYWRLREVRGTVAKDECMTNDGTYSPNSGGAWTGGTLAALATPFNRDNGFAPTFNGSTGYTTTSSFDFSFADSTIWTIEAWLYYTNATNRQTLWGNDNAANQVQIEVGSTYAGSGITTAGSGIIINGSGVTGIANNSLPINQWNHLVYTRNGAASTMAAYVNGASVALINTPTVSALINGASSKLIGRRASGSQFMAGTPAEVAVYPTALTLNQVLSHYRAGIDGTRR